MKAWEHENAKANRREFWRLNSGRFRVSIVKDPTISGYLVQVTGWEDIPLSRPQEFPTLETAMDGARLFVQRYVNSLNNLRKAIKEANDGD